jgi:hypothetical protein
MKLIKTIGTFIIILLLSNFLAKAQPTPIELMIGQKYGTVNLIYDRHFSQNSRFGLFHMNTVQFDYKSKIYNSFILQDQLYVETLKNLRVSGGVVYSNGGFNPTAGLQYVYGGRKLFFLCAPRINIKSNPSYDLMTILQFKPEINDRLKLYTRFELLHLFDSGGNIKSYQWIRLGLEVKGIQFGLAADFDEYGPDPSAKSNFGVFIRKEIF